MSSIHRRRRSVTPAGLVVWPTSSSTWRRWWSRPYGGMSTPGLSSGQLMPRAWISRWVQETSRLTPVTSTRVEKFSSHLACLCFQDYYEFIRNPMDLGTVRQRLQNRFYWTGRDCIQDLKTIFKNCYTYNYNKVRTGEWNNKSDRLTDCMWDKEVTIKEIPRVKFNSKKLSPLIKKWQAWRYLVWSTIKLL